MKTKSSISKSRLAATLTQVEIYRNPNRVNAIIVSVFGNQLRWVKLSLANYLLNHNAVCVVLSLYVVGAQLG